MHHAETSLLFVSIGDQSIFLPGEGGYSILIFRGRECEEDFSGITGSSGETEVGLVANSSVEDFS